MLPSTGEYATDIHDWPGGPTPLASIREIRVLPALISRVARNGGESFSRGSHLQSRHRAIPPEFHITLESAIDILGERTTSSQRTSRGHQDRKSTRLNSSHPSNSYAV